MRTVPANGGVTLPPKTKPVKQKSGKSSRAVKSAEPPWEDTPDGLQIDLEDAATAAGSGLYLIVALFKTRLLSELMREHPLTEHHLAQLCTHLIIGLGTAVNESEISRQKITDQKRKGGGAHEEKRKSRQG